MEHAISSLAIRRLLQEIKEEIEGKYLSKIQQLDKNTYRLRFSPGSKDLILEPGKRINLTRYRLKAPKKPFQSSMVLRKHLPNTKLENIEQIDFDRVVKLNFTNGKKIIVELFANGNLILTDENNNIIYAQKTTKWKDREIKKDEKYQPPQSRLFNPFETNEEELKEALHGKKTVAALAANLGLGGAIAEKICTDAKIEKNKPAEELDEKEIKKLYKHMKKLLETDTKPVKQANRIRPIPLDEETQKIYDSLNQAIDEEYTQQKEEYKEPDKLIKLKKRLESQRKSIEKFKEKSEENKKKGDLIYKKYSQISKAIQLYRKGKIDKLKELGVSIEDGELVFNLD